MWQAISPITSAEYSRRSAQGAKFNSTHASHSNLRAESGIAPASLHMQCEFVEDNLLSAAENRQKSLQDLGFRPLLNCWRFFHPSLVGVTTRLPSRKHTLPLIFLQEKKKPRLLSSLLPKYPNTKSTL